MLDEVVLEFGKPHPDFFQPFALIGNTKERCEAMTTIKAPCDLKSPANGNQMFVDV